MLRQTELTMQLKGNSIGQAIGHLYAQKPQSTRIYPLVITALELGFKLGFVHRRKRQLTSDR